MEKAAARNEYVQAFERGLAIISSFDGSSLTLSEVAQRVGMSPAAARRYLSTLTELGYFSQDSGQFSAEAKLIELSAPYFAANATIRRAERALQELTRRIDETSVLTQLRVDEVVNVLAIQTTQELAIQVVPGRLLPAHCTAMGRAMLSLLTQQEASELVKNSQLERRTTHTRTRVQDILEQIELARVQGYAIVEEEHTPGIRTMSIAFRLPSNQLAALSAPTPMARETRAEYVARVEEPLRAAVASVTGSRDNG